MNTFRRICAAVLFCACQTQAADGLGRIQAMIDAKAAEGGGRVTVPAGTWITGPLSLSGGIELHLTEGARLVFPDMPELYFDGAEAAPRPLVGAVAATNVAITGKGTLEARTGYWDDMAYPRKIRRPRFILFKDCKDVRLEGFRVRNSPSWTIHMLCTDNVVIRGLDMRCFGRNNDGIDLDSVQGALIEDCRLDQGDDAICMKSGLNEEGRRRARPTKDVLIRNCTVVNGHTLLGIGSELSGGIENIRLENCKVTGEVWRVLRIKTNADRGGYVRGVSVKGVTVGRAKCAIVEITNGYTFFNSCKGKYHTPIEDITVEDVVCREGWRAYELLADPDVPAKNVAIRNCVMENPSRGVSIAQNVEGLTVENTVSVPEPFSVWCDDPDSLYRCGKKAVFHVVSSLTEGVAHVKLEDGAGNVLRGFEVDLSRRRDFTVEGVRNTPGFLLLTVTCGKTVKRWGAAFSPDEIAGTAARPAGLAKFWREAATEYARAVPEDVKLERIGGRPEDGCTVSTISLKGPDGVTVRGFLKVPEDHSAGPFPVVVTVREAGSSGVPPACGDRNTVALVLDVPAFGRGGVLAADRAVRWLCRRPWVDRNRIFCLSAGRGGATALALVAVNGGFRGAMFETPVFPDTDSPFLDSAALAAMITCPAVFSAGYADVTAPPHKVYAAYNACPSAKKKMFGGVGLGHGPNPVDSCRMRVWLEDNAGPGFSGM